MFESLRDRLARVRRSLGSRLGDAMEAGEEREIPPEKAGAAAPVRPADEKKVKPGIGEKMRVLVAERGLVISEKDLEEPLFELEMALLENDVALPVAESIAGHIRDELVGTTRGIFESPDAVVRNAMNAAIRSVLGDPFDLPEYIRSHERPVRILFTGVNGTGKTTTIAKVAKYLQDRGFSVVIGAGDTYRAGALEQIGTHARRLGIRVVQHQEGADPSAVLYDTVEYARAHKIDVVLADTAGRFHNRKNLMNQLEKIRRVMKPDLVIYVDEAVAGNDAVVRAGEFERAVGTDGVILTKADMDPRGGAAISIAHTVKKPLLFLGTGQGYDDIVQFTPSLVTDALLGGEE
ncbi:MAG: signal recognition particle-docking protein FtsY [Methanoculleaceae archaeon]